MGVSLYFMILGAIIFFGAASHSQASDERLRCMEREARRSDTDEDFAKWLAERVRVGHPLDEVAADLAARIELPQSNIEDPQPRERTSAVLRQFWQHQITEPASPYLKRMHTLTQELLLEAPKKMKAMDKQVDEINANKTTTAGTKILKIQEIGHRREGMHWAHEAAKERVKAGRPILPMIYASTFVPVPGSQTGAMIQRAPLSQGDAAILLGRDPIHYVNHPDVPYREGTRPVEEWRNYPATELTKAEAERIVERLGPGWSLPSHTEMAGIAYGALLHKLPQTEPDQANALLEYAVLAINSDGRVRQTGLLREDDHQLKDLLGNVAIWCSGTLGGPAPDVLFGAGARENFQNLLRPTVAGFQSVVTGVRLMYTPPKQS